MIRFLLPAAAALVAFPALADVMKLKDMHKQLEKVVVGECELQSSFDFSDPFGVSVSVNLLVNGKAVTAKPLKMHYTAYSFDAANSLWRSSGKYQNWMKLSGWDNSGKHQATHATVTVWKGSVDATHVAQPTWLEFNSKVYGLHEGSDRRGPGQIFRNYWPSQRIHVTCEHGKPAVRS